MDFCGKSVVITGAASGLGRAITKVFATNKAELALLDINMEGLRQIKSELHSQKVLTYEVDVTDYEKVQEAGKRIVSDRGRIDVLVNCAGGGKEFLLGFRELDEITWNKQINLNLNSMFYCCKMVLEQMIKQRSGKIINVSSVAGLRGGGLLGKGAYATAKAGVLGLTKALAREVGEYGINVNAVAPGLHLTPLTGGTPTEKIELIKTQLPLKACGDPEKLGELVAFLASESAQFITGAVITVDGGYAMH